MSKLPNAPLIEVIFEIKWQSNTPDELSKYEYLHGDLYFELKPIYPYREYAAPPDLPVALLHQRPVHRFRTKENGYPLFQVGPGILTFNTTDDDYFWDKYYWSAGQLIDRFFSVYTLTPDQTLIPSLTYIDFFKLNFDEVDAIGFLNEKLNISLSQGFHETTRIPKTLNMSFSYEIDLGDIFVSLNTGVNRSQQKGIIMETRVNGKKSSPLSDNLLSWLDQAHTFCSDLFKKMTAGELYGTFK